MQRTRRELFALLGSAGLALVPGVVSRAGAAPMRHIVLLGDSTLDNAAYVRSGEDVPAQLRQRMPAEWKATLLAVDGGVAADVERQLAGLPRDASHLVVSVGGNDALRHAGILQESARSMADALGRLADVQAAFASEYRAMLDAVQRQGLAVAVCTIYRAAFPDPELRTIAATALCVLNDVITREAASRGLPLIDLRVIFDSDEDYANAIEPSAAGGGKFAAAIVDLISRHDFAERRAEIFVARR